MAAIFLPSFSDAANKATIVAWFLKEGAFLKEGDELVEVMTDEVSYRIIADTSGILKKIHYQPGDEVSCFEKLADIAEKQE